MQYDFIVFRRCLEDTNKLMSCKDHSVALRVFTDWINLESKYVEILEITDKGLMRRMIVKDTP